MMITKTTKRPQKCDVAAAVVVDVVAVKTTTEVAQKLGTTMMARSEKFPLVSAAAGVVVTAMTRNLVSRCPPI